MSYFDEKSPQLSTGEIQAFGIDLQSRYARAGEMVEMLEFAELAATRGLHHLVASVFYDSNSCCCNFTLQGDVEPLSDVDEAIRQCALETIGQFDWDGTVYHGREN